MEDILKELSWRGLVHHHTDMEALKHALGQPVTLYAGFDPTAPSLHVGHLLVVVTLERFRRAGHSPIALVGGATALVGDPSGRRSERPLAREDEVQAAQEALALQLRHLGNETVLNNKDWFQQMSALDLLRDVGKHFTVNEMLSRASVAIRLEDGLSFTEFAYSLLQAQDFNHLHQAHGVTLQVGGSDQWGNITAGASLVRKNTGEVVHGLTVPLLVDHKGDKMGKSAGGAVWLDPARTSPLDLFQYLLGVDDSDAGGFLRKLTFLTEAEILSLEEEVNNSVEARKGRVLQRRLAQEVTRLVHGQVVLGQVEATTRNLWGKAITAEGLLQSDEASSFNLSLPMNVMNALVETGLCSSKGAGRRLMRDGGIRLNGGKVTQERDLTEADLLQGKVLQLSVGRKRHALVLPAS